MPSRVKTLFRNLFRFIKRRWLLLVIIAAVVGGILFWRQRQANNQPEMSFTTPTQQDIVETLEVSGVVDAKEKASMRFATGGKVTYLGAQEGDIVKRFQTIARVDMRQQQKQLQKELNAYENTRIDFDQVQDDTKDRALPTEEQREKAKTQNTLEDSVLDVEIQSIAISNGVLSAPFAGVLVSSPTTVTGVNLLATDVFELVNPASLVFKAAVDEADIARVQLGQTGTISLDAYPDDPATSMVDAIAYKSSESSTGTVFLIEFPLTGDNLLSRYRLGMNGDVDIELARAENVMTIPAEAVRQRDGKYFVDVRTGETTTEEREITVGLETEDLVEVKSGLQSNDEVLLP